MMINPWYLFKVLLVYFEKSRIGFSPMPVPVSGISFHYKDTINTLIVKTKGTLLYEIPFFLYE